MVPVAAVAQQAADEADIVVTAQQMQRGAVIGDIKPELQLGPADIRARGVSSVAELIADLGPQLRSGRGGQPVVLLEGRRISGFREIATLPAEAIARVDILPEEVALKYGYPADQKVVNIVLRQRFKAFTVEVADRIATGSGGNQTEAEFDYLRIQKDGRFNLHLEQLATNAITEAQRGIDDTNGIERFRTLTPSNRQFTATATLNRIVAGDVSATLNSELRTEDTRDTFGRSGDEALARTAGSQAAHVGTTLNGTLAKWRWTFTANYDHGEGKTLIDPSSPLAVALHIADQARSRSDLGTVDFTVNGKPFTLPAGDVSLTVKGGASFSGFVATSVRTSLTQTGLIQTGRVARNIANGQISVDLPLTSRKENVLGVIGDVSLNGNYAVQRLSDFGTLNTYGGGVTWGPVKGLNLIGSYSSTAAAPSPQQIGNPVVTTPNVPAFDLVTGRNAVVTLVSGGNRALRASTVDTYKFEASIKPFAADLSLTATYGATRTSNGIAGLPQASFAAEAAFPGRFMRSAGVLTQIDSRAVNFARAQESQIRWGLNFSQPLKNSQAQTDVLRAAFRARFPNGPPGGPGGPAAAAGPGRGGPGGGFGGGGFGGGGFGGAGGRLSLSLYHTLHLEDRVTLASGLPPIDLLRGGTIGSGGGQPRHEVELQAGLAKNGYGLRLIGNWQSATRVTGTTPASDLRFSDLGTLNLRLFANITQAFPKTIKTAPWLTGVRVSLIVGNIFDARQRVTDANGVTPIAYLPGYLDPLGRTVRINLRKLLF